MRTANRRATSSGCGWRCSSSAPTDTPTGAGAGLWELASGERESARWRRVADDEIARSDDWQGFLAWLDKTAEHMRQAGEDEHGAPR
jgi:hypothetical protein